jgi:hypothetical protein
VGPLSVYVASGLSREQPLFFCWACSLTTCESMGRGERRGELGSAHLARLQLEAFGEIHLGLEPQLHEVRVLIALGHCLRLLTRLAARGARGGAGGGVSARLRGGVEALTPQHC